MTHAYKIAISLPKEDYEKLEEIRKAMGIARSIVIDKAIRFWLKWIEEKELIKRYEMGYRKKPEKVNDLKALESAELEVLGLDEEWEAGI